MSELETLGAICSAAAIAQAAENSPANMAATKAAYSDLIAYRNARRVEDYAGIIRRNRGYEGY